MSEPIEFVWVVRRRDLFPDHSPQGFHPLPAEELEARWLSRARDRGFFVERREAETCPAWKQVIPYCLVEHEGRYLLIERLPAQGETRLHGKLSIGIGGHLNPPDRTGPDLITAGAVRELDEELELPADFELRPLGLLNDDSDPVGAVHVGIVFGVTCDEAPQIREKDKMKGALTPLAEIRALCQTRRVFESWSAAVLRSDVWDTRF